MSLRLFPPSSGNDLEVDRGSISHLPFNFVFKIVQVHSHNPNHLFKEGLPHPSRDFLDEHNQGIPNLHFKNDSKYE